MARRIEVLSLALTAIGVTAAVFAWPDFRWKVLGDAKYKPQLEQAPPGQGWTSSAEGASIPPPVSREGSLDEWVEIRARDVRASSVLPPSRIATYGPELAVDGKWSTVWVEGAEGDGSGEWVRLELQSPSTVRKIGIVNGYGSGPRFLENERIREARIGFSDGTTQSIHLRDNNDLQYFVVGPKTTTYVTLTIQSVYPGSRWTDAAIGEIRLWSTR